MLFYFLMRKHWLKHIKRQLKGVSKAYGTSILNEGNRYGLLYFKHLAGIHWYVGFAIFFRLILKMKSTQKIGGSCHYKSLNR